MLISKKDFEKKVDERVYQILSQVREDVYVHLPKQLDPKSYYILIVPPSVPLDEIKAAFDAFQGSLNIVVLQAEGVKLLELG